MPYILKELNITDEDNSQPPLYFAGTIRIGSKDDCDLVLKTPKMLPFHCELYHRGNEFRFVANQSAFVEINDSDVLRWPAVLNDGDILTIGDTKFQFNIIQPIPRRSWRASFAANLAIALLVLLIIFEISIMIWLPYTLYKTKAWEFATAKQNVIRQIDRVRNKTRELRVGSPAEVSIKKLMLNCENSIAEYLRKYSQSMNRAQTRTVHKDLYKLEIIADQWPHYRKIYTYKTKINPDTYLQNLCDQLDNDHINLQKTNNNSNQK